MIELPFSSPKVKLIVKAAFPEARSRRTVKVHAATSYTVMDFWDGGSRNYAVGVDLRTLTALPASSIPRKMRQVEGNPFNLPLCELAIPPGYADVALVPGVAVVEHCIFCGKDLGYSIYANEATVHEGWLLG